MFGNQGNADIIMIIILVTERNIKNMLSLFVHNVTVSGDVYAGRIVIKRNVTIAILSQCMVSKTGLQN